MIRENRLEESVEYDLLRAHIGDDAERYRIGMKWFEIVTEMHQRTNHSHDRHSEIYNWIFDQKIELLLFCMGGSDFMKHGCPLRFPYLFGHRMIPMITEEMKDLGSIVFFKGNYNTFMKMSPSRNPIPISHCAGKSVKEIKARMAM
jgi:hypothetical protein